MGTPFLLLCYVVHECMSQKVQTSNEVLFISIKLCSQSLECLKKLIKNLPSLSEVSDDKLVGGSLVAPRCCRPVKRLFSMTARLSSS